MAIFGSYVPSANYGDAFRQSIHLKQSIAGKVPAFSRPSIGGIRGFDPVQRKISMKSVR